MILGLLAEGEKHGYELLREMEERGTAALDARQPGFRLQEPRCAWRSRVAGFMEGEGRKHAGEDRLRHHRGGRAQVEGYGV